jgi:hypothetical protein
MEQPERHLPSAKKVRQQEGSEEKGLPATPYSTLHWSAKRIDESTVCEI